MSIQTILLAAGVGSRFGSDKLSATLPDGTPMAVASARSLVAAGCDVLAVVRDVTAESALLLATEAGVRVLACPESAGGLGHSLAYGVRHSADADGWLVALADMPFIRPETVIRVMSALEQGAPLVAVALAGRRGHPVGFGRRWRGQLLGLTGDAGARSLLAEQASELQIIETDDPGVLQDLDRPEDLLQPRNGSCAP